MKAKYVAEESMKEAIWLNKLILEMEFLEQEVNLRCDI